MRLIDWELEDGFPLDQGKMKFTQDEMLDRMMGYITYWQNSIGENHFIITGMERDTTAGLITPGWCFIGGKLLYYPGGAYPGDTASIRPVLTETEVEYEDGIDRPALKSWVATVTVGGGSEGIFYLLAKRVPKIQALTWQNLTGIPDDLVFDDDYTHTALLNKLNGIEAGAEKNVQADWAQTDQNHDSYIKNKPTDMMRPQVVGAVDVSLVAQNGFNPTVTASGDIYSAVATAYDEVGITITITHPPIVDGLPIFYFQSIGGADSLNATIQDVVTEKTDSTLKFYLNMNKYAPYVFRINLTILK
jgi:hypothetical protein